MADQHPELAAEQQYVDAAYARLDAMRRAAARVAEGYSEVGAGGTHQARLERDAADALTRRRLAALDIGEAPLCFGRLDLRGADGHPDAEASPVSHRIVPSSEPGPERPGGAAAESGGAVADRDGESAGPGERRFYVGRIGVNDEEQTPLVVDWRAPVAEPFYRATAISPMGVVRRRHFVTRPGHGRELVGLDDEVFDAGAAGEAGLTVVGEGALLASLDRARTGRMGDIVATIQIEQDEAIRADLAGVLIVAGGPGTGKTAVALHRAAYLLYTHRKRLGSQGVLLVGPNTIFLRYIDQVLPSLGEADVQLTTPAGLKPQYRVLAEDDPAVAEVKGDARMAQVINRAIRDREHPLPRDTVAVLDGTVLRLRRGESQRIVDRTRSRRGTHNERRPFVVRAVVEHLRAQYRRSMGATAPDDPDWDRELDARIRRLPEVQAALERMWPVLTGGELVHDLFSFTALVRSASDGLLTRRRAGVAAPVALQGRPRRRLDRTGSRADRRGRCGARFDGVGAPPAASQPPAQR